MKRPLVLALAAAGTLGAAGSAQAARVDWSIGINLLPVATYVSRAPIYAPVLPIPRPVFFATPFYVEPAPAVRRIVVTERPRRWAPLPAFVSYRHDRWHHDRDDRGDRGRGEQNVGWRR